MAGTMPGSITGISCIVLLATIGAPRSSDRPAASAAGVGLGGEPASRESPPRVRLTTIDAESVDGRLLSITPRGVLHYQGDGREGAVALDDLHRIMHLPPDAGSPGAKTPHERQPSGQDPRHPRRVFHLANGGRLLGELLPAPGGGARTLRVDVGLVGPLDVPIDALAAVRFATTDAPEAERELMSRIADRPTGRDLLIVARPGKPAVLPGALERLTPEAFEFRFGDSLRTASLDQAYAVVLGGVSPRRDAPPATIHFGHANSLAARIVSADIRVLVADAGPMGTLEIPWKQVRQIDLRSGRVVYVSDLEPAGTVRRSILETDWPVRRDRNVTGGPITLRGRIYDKGLGVHAYTALTYDLNAEFERFTAVLGIDDAVAPHGTAIFRVLADGRTLHESKAEGGRMPRRVSLDVTGVKSLTLECDGGEDLDLSDHADWANAMLIRSRANSRARTGVRKPTGHRTPKGAAGFSPRGHSPLCRASILGAAIR